MQTESPKTSIFDVLKNFDSLPDSARVRKPVVLALTGYSDATLYRRIAAGLAPAPHKETPRLATWSVGELRRALQLNRTPA
jgi:predicted DNA-binding transcriptional regulator AlpA